MQHGKFCFETVILRDVDADLLSGTDEKQFVGVLGCLAAVGGGGILGGGGGGRWQCCGRFGRFGWFDLCGGRGGGSGGG